MPDKLALVFSGGGAKGAFGAGVFQRILQRFPGLRWHIVTGTSTGALIAPYAALAAQDAAHAESLVAFYRHARRKDIVKSNLTLWRLIKSLWDLPEGLTSLEPLRRLINRTLTDGLMQQVDAGPVVTVITAVNLQRGRLVLCTQDRYRPGIEAWYLQHSHPRWGMRPDFVPFEEFRLMMLASSAVPFATEPIVRRSEQLVDGGVIDEAPLRAAIAAGATDALVVMMSPPPPTVVARRFENLISVGFRAIDLLQDEVVRNDVDHLRAAARLNRAEAGGDRGARAAVERADPYVAAYLDSGTTVDPVIVEPAVPLGDTMDFDSSVPATWPGGPPSGPSSLPIMEARIDYGRRVVDALLADSKTGLEPLLSRYSVRS